VALLLRLTRAGIMLVATGTLVLLAAGFWLMEIGHYDLGDGWLAQALNNGSAAVMLAVLALMVVKPS
jgi:uncharacterized membrane protein